MNTLILLSVLPIVLLYLGLFKAKNALLPVTVIGLLAALVLAIRYFFLTFQTKSRNGWTTAEKCAKFIAA